MALQIKQIIPCDAFLYYTRDWVNDATSFGYLKVKSEPLEDLLGLPSEFYFDITPCLGLALVEKGAKQFVTPLDYSQEERKIVPIDPDLQDEYVFMSSNYDCNMDPFKLEIINKIKDSNE